MKKHSVLLPSQVRGLVVGPSNSGKTNLMLTLLIDKNGLKFKNVYLFSNSLHQPKYDLLDEILKRVDGVCFFRFKNEFLKPEEVERNSVVIFDDVMSERQNPIQDFFSMGRHMSVDCFYLAQTYSRIPKQLIRDNSNVIVLFKMDDMNLRHAYADHVITDMPYSQFREMCASCWKEPFGFLLINKESERDNGRYRDGFDKYISP
ncbi:unnamed protein product [Bemisia tabaci]|uniref:Uncharacterized protein n=1 Tax=Bemisia tabaci TaxID=7038 RepID=A0A9P0F3L3_BEMTA|nr:unnamed protein product [Bemisia tabaci]